MMHLLFNGSFEGCRKSMGYGESSCDGIDLHFMEDNNADEDDWLRSAPVKFISNDISFRNRLKRFFLRNPSTRLGSRIFDLVIKFLLCFLYIIRVELDDPQSYACGGMDCSVHNLTLPKDSDEMVFSSNAINWHVLVWVRRPLAAWVLQVFLSVVTLVKACVELYIGSKGICLTKMTSDGFILELVCSVPLIATVFYPPLLIDLYVPSFLHCWLMRRSCQKLFHDLHLTKQRFQTISVTLSQQMLILVVTLACFIFTTICGIQHIQRGSEGKQLSLFESVYFVIVTFSTVGYGDISPDTWLGQLFMMFMICFAFAFVPRQIEGITSVWRERKKTGGEYSRNDALGHRHVVVFSSHLTADNVMDFLLEFYAHPKLEEHVVVFVSSDEKDSNLQVILKDPKWVNRVVYIQGSALKDIDLKRCRIQEADACFILSPSLCQNREEADEHSILRSWAVKDFAPDCRQYIQLFKTEYKIHVTFAEHVVCADEFKYALLANNCLYPGLSTLVTLLLHTTTEQIGTDYKEQWQQVYGRHAGNQVYHIQISKSVFFRSYIGKSFTEASKGAHKRFGVCLVAVLDITKLDPRLQLNPGPEYKLKDTDYCFYIGEFKEEYSKICHDVSSTPHLQKTDNDKSRKNLDHISEVLEKLLQHELEEENAEEESVFNNTITFQWGQEIARRVRNNSEKTNSNNSQEDLQTDINVNVINSQVDTHSQTDSALPKVLQIYSDMGQEEFTTGSPPTTLYVGNRRTMCHILKNPRQKCCLKWGEDCEHCSYKNAKDSRWKNQLIIMSASQACGGIHNFLVPLRSHYISMHLLSPIVLLLENDPEDLFLETICEFPMVYWMKGKITNIDHLLLAGIHKSSHFVIVNKESFGELEETMVDSQTIVAVQTILKLFPHTNIITELSQATNIRFMQFQANNEYNRYVSRMEKKLRGGMSSTLSHIFRLPFASGQVFSASMLDSLLYQTFVKGYLITFVRLLLGIDAEENSGHLSSIRVRGVTLAQYPTYGELYHGVAATTGEIPFAIYRTEKSQSQSNDLFTNEPQITMKKLFKLDGKERLNNNGNNQSFKKKTVRPSFPKQPFMGKDTEHSDIGDLIRNRLKNLGMNPNDYTDDEDQDVISYVILNPTPKRKLRLGDIVYVIQPSSMNAIPSKKGWSTIKTSLMRSFSSGKSTGLKTSTQRLFAESQNQTIPESPNDQGIHFEAKPKKQRRKSDPNAPRRMSRFTVEAISNVPETSLSKEDLNSASGSSVIKDKFY
ncbi:potassium channel subfamily T member 1-like isoform X3 [Mytilus trossulus]|uniref:potassium channel subfamily T member 1-like isoform X3 n=1 Tax=Mytilus trossulus TaxID=6551 RepID=UPI0030044E55